MGSPFGAGFGGGLGGIAIGSEVSGDVVFVSTGAVGEGDDEGVVAEGVGLLIELVGERSIKGEGDGLPLSVGSGDFYGAVSVIFAGLLKVGEDFFDDLFF